ncbi:M56 family metallopeptidase [Nocardiopsis sp. FIRDI 009]|uniref:M56 family metallopeptidase n=1 Tax=Nocardiopsis sp. FIRDI 009 TaxID=714197 RepID=UPI000E2618FF|nr:M56 family metallopeptidase [Nocardiopsis sp. FIRDI 009]
MSAAPLLAAHTVAGLLLVAPLLRRAAWVDRAPRLGLLAWQVLTFSVLVSAVLAGITLAVPVTPVSGDLAQVLHSCAAMLRRAYATPGGAFTATAGLAVSAVVVLRTGYGLGAEWARTVLDRRRHLAALAVVGTGNARLGATVVDHDACAAYCLPGRGGHVVLTSAALAALDGPELTAVLAHEREHLRRRHHLMVASARGVQRAFPFASAFAHARAEVARLTELAADDAAASATDRLTVAGALLALARGDRGDTAGQAPPADGIPGVALAASGSGSGRRVRRLLDAQPPLGRGGLLVAAVAVGAALAVPFAVVAPSGLLTATVDCCLVHG